MSSDAKHGWQSSVVLLLVVACVGAESQLGAHSHHPYLQSDKTICTPGGVMFDIRGVDDRTVFKRRPILSSITHAVATLVSTLL